MAPKGQIGAVTDHGMTLTTVQGVAEAINFHEAGAGKVETTGDFVLTAEEVNPAISALEEHDIQVTALHSHMLAEQPRLFFMHFWTVGSTEAMWFRDGAAICPFKSDIGQVKRGAS